mmetsp:Transcript_12645/g.37609  ORF Transcript_12645/g.37609 Transcript_12645/m.37609 type:complete len:201 (-) Transcript_12645:249-851(-)
MAAGAGASPRRSRRALGVRRAACSTARGSRRSTRARCQTRPTTARSGAASRAARRAAAGTRPSRTGRRPSPRFQKDTCIIRYTRTACSGARWTGTAARSSRTDRWVRPFPVHGTWPVVSFVMFSSRGNFPHQFATPLQVQCFSQRRCYAPLRLAFRSIGRRLARCCVGGSSVEGGRSASGPLTGAALRRLARRDAGAPGA